MKIPAKSQALLWLLLSSCVALTTWLSLHRIQPPGPNGGEAADSQLEDLYPRWVGTRALLLYGRNPYSPEVSHEIQMAWYGHIVNQDLDDSSARSFTDEQRFVYPVYVVFLMAPLSHTDFARVHFWAPFVLEFAAAVALLACLAVLEWRPPWPVMIALVLFILSSPQIVQGVRRQQLAIVVGGLLMAGLWFIRRGHLATAGALFAWATIKPQLALLPLLGVFIWSLGDWRARWRLTAAFAATLAALALAGEALLPGWIGDFVRGIYAYRRYFPTSSVLRVALGDTAGEILAGLIIIWLFWFAWQNRKAKADSREFMLLAAAFFVGAIIALPLFTPFNQVLLILPVMLVLRDWTRLPSLAQLVFTAFVSWPWIAEGILLISPKLALLRSSPTFPFLLLPLFPLILAVLLVILKTSYSKSGSKLAVPER